MSARRDRLVERTEHWPSMRVTVEVAPWHWRLAFWRDAGMTKSFRLDLGPLALEVWSS